jgi:flavin reductase (DIM6/NTAB) family NADH-FMN oxidoreductase RutF
MEVSVTFYQNGKTNMENLKNAFVASKDPPYVGLILKPGVGIWEYMKDHDDLIFNLHDSSVTAEIKYRIDVGENSIFFLTSDNKKFSELV